MFDIFGTRDQRDHYLPSLIGAAPFTAQDMRSKSVLILTGDDVEDLEFFYPFYRFAEEGVRVDAATPEGGDLKGRHGIRLSRTLPIEKIDISAYAMLYLPGGKAPASLRKDRRVVPLVERFVQSGKPVAAICRGLQLLTAAGAVRGRRIAACPEMEKEITDAGGIYVNEAAVRDGQLITARWPADLPLHMRAVLAALRAHPSMPNAVAA